MMVAPQKYQQILQVCAPTGPVVASSQLLVKARPVLLLQSSNETFVRRNEARLISPDIEIESKLEVTIRIEQRRQLILIEMQRARLSCDLREKLRLREGDVCRDESAQRGAHHSAAPAIGDRAVTLIDHRDEFRAQEIAIIIVCPVLAHAIYRVDHHHDERRNLTCMNQVVQYRGH